jgi:hypothetical protein
MFFFHNWTWEEDKIFPLCGLFCLLYHTSLPYCSFFRRGTSKDFFTGKGAFSCVGQPTLQILEIWVFEKSKQKNWPISGIWGKQNQRIASCGCFQNLKESLTFVKEPPVLHQFFNFFFLGQSQGISEGWEQQFCYVVNFAILWKELEGKIWRACFF